MIHPNILQSNRVCVYLGCAVQRWVVSPDSLSSLFLCTAPSLTPCVPVAPVSPAHGHYPRPPSADPEPPTQHKTQLILIHILTFTVTIKKKRPGPTRGHQQTSKGETRDDLKLCKMIIIIITTTNIITIIIIIIIIVIINAIISVLIY